MTRPRPAGRPSVLVLGSIVIVACALASAAAFAQESTGGIRGIIRDDTGGVLAGVTVEAASPSRIGVPAVAVSTVQGGYRFENLPPGSYSLTFSLSGFSTVKRDGIRVEVGRSVQLDQTLVLGSVTETVTVSGQSPVVDSVHASTSTTFNQQLIENIPTTRGSSSSLVNYAPAVRSDAAPGTVKWVIYGSNAEQNSFQMDGVDIAAPSYGSPWDYLGYDIIQELEVKAVGASAEFSGFQGGVINAVTRSGTNTLKGMASTFTDYNWLKSNNTPDEEFPARIFYRYDMTGMLGGPIKRDRLWFQGIVQGSVAKSTPVAVDPQYAAQSHSWKPFFKITARPSNHDQIDYTQNDNRFYSPTRANRTTPIFTTTVEHGVNPDIATRWTHTFGSSTLLEVKGGGIYIRDRFDPYSKDLTTPGHNDQSTGFSSVNATSVSRSYQNKTTVNANVAHAATDFITGLQEFKFGVQFGHQKALANSGTPGGISFLDRNGAPYEATVRDPSGTGGRIRDLGGFIQDNWTLTDRVALNLGVRYDHTIGDVPVVPQLDNGAETETGQEFPGIPNVITFDTISPRFGMTVKLDQRGKTVAKASYGRYYGKLITNMFSALSPGNTITNVYGFNSATGKYDILKRTTNPNINYRVDQDLKNQYTDQLYIGLERELMADLGVDISFVHKGEGNFIRLNDFGGTFALQPFVDRFRGVTQTIMVYNQTNATSQSLYTVTNRDDLEQEFNSVVVQAYKRFSRGWQMQTSYQWQRGRGYAGGSIGVNAQDFGSLGTGGFGRDPNDLINSYGRLPTDTTHAFKVSTTYQAPFDIHLGLRYSYESPRPYARVVTVTGLRQGSRTVIAEDRGSYALPALNDFQVRFDKDLPFGGRRRLRLSVDVFNIFNSATVLTLRNNSSQTGDALFGQSLSLSSARQARLGFRYEF
jgi:outer membrane receptor protein involved in Fe transport